MKKLYTMFLKVMLTVVVISCAVVLIEGAYWATDGMTNVGQYKLGAHLKAAEVNYVYKAKEGKTFKLGGVFTDEITVYNQSILNSFRAVATLVVKRTGVKTDKESNKAAVDLITYMLYGMNNSTAYAKALNFDNHETLVDIGKVNEILTRSQDLLLMRAVKEYTKSEYRGTGVYRSVYLFVSDELNGLYDYVEVASLRFYRRVR